MAASETLVSLPVSSPLMPAMHDGSASNMSSPLSDVEDKDGDDDLMELEMMRKTTASTGNTDRDAAADSDLDDSAAAADDDDDSNLSEVDINDSEAETERLHESPSKAKDFSPTSTPRAIRAGKAYVNSRERDFQFSPSKLKQQTRAGESDDDNDVASSSDKEQSDSELSTASGTAKTARHSPRNIDTDPNADRPRDTGDTSVSSTSDTRKRKRSPAAESVEARQPVKKRIGSVAPGADGAEDVATVNSTAEATPANTNNGEHSGEETDSGDRKVNEYASSKSLTGTGATTTEPTSPGRAKRSSTRKQVRGTEVARGHTGHSPEDDIPKPTTEGGARTEEEHGEGDTVMDVEGADGDVDGDGDAEISHKDEEELERRKAAQSFIIGLEKSFADFRDQYYEERIRLLDEEEAMLTSLEPTHPQYLAMMQCVDARRNDRLQIVDAEYRLNQESLSRWAVAGRAQIMSQYYQDVRKTRERVLEELGDEWYRIQQQRRWHANNVPDFSIPYPETRSKAIKQANAYNKEVSILSGIAKHHGFPGAPRIAGATLGEIEDDLEEIARARRANGHRHAGAVAATFQDYGAIPNERILGPAGEEFLKQTPWANPNHPSHQMARPRDHPEAEPPGNIPAVGGPLGQRQVHPPARRAPLADGISALNGTPVVSPILTKNGIVSRD